MGDVFKTLGDALNPNQKENVKPLYKRLDAERTQGDWLLSKNTDIEQLYITATSKTIAFLNYQDNRGLNNKAEQKANSSYAALAVNNLLPIAEALEELIKMHCQLHRNAHTSTEIRRA